MTERDLRPAFYAAPRGGWRDWWTILHPPYTAWHLSYVALGAALAPTVDGGRLVATLVAFFFAVGIGAHALDEVNGHPLGTTIDDRALWVVGGGGVVVAVVMGAVGVSRIGGGLIVFMVIGPVLLLTYNLEWFGGRLHTDLVFALAWGAFPVVTSFYAQAERLDLVAVVGAIAATLLSVAQRSLSTPARQLRRRTMSVEGTITRRDGSRHPLDLATILHPLERALHVLSWSLVALAAAMTAARFR
jgi:hypothetical protein